MTTSYFTFGQNHEHNFGGLTLNRDTILKITADQPRDVMVTLFGTRWSHEYDKLDPDMLRFWPAHGELVTIKISADNLHDSL